MSSIDATTATMNSTDKRSSTGTTGAPLLSIEALNVSLDENSIIKNLSLRVESGEILGLVGASGSGKSMTALAIMQLLPERARLHGAVSLQGVNLIGNSARELRNIRGRHIGMVFQEPMSALNPSMRIGDQVAETVLLHRAATAAGARVMAREALDAVGLTGNQGALDRYPHELSGGQRQRVAIAIAVVLRPALLIADEPTTALDVSTQAQVLALLGDLARRRRMGLILVSHDLAVIAQLTDRVAVMQAGEIVEQATTTDTLRGLQHPYSKALLAAAVLMPKRQTRPGVSTAIDTLPVDTSSTGSSSVAALHVTEADSAVVHESALNTAAPAAVLEVRDVVREYPLRRRSPWRATGVFRAVDHVSLVIYPGETVGLVGESGSGKSSLLRAILSLDRVQAGDVSLFGESLLQAGGRVERRLRRGIQAVFQDPYGSFDPRWSVEKLVSEPFYLFDAQPAPTERRRKVAAVLEQVGLSAADAVRHPHEFSGGQRQRIAIARALITEPSVVVFDEALSALDVLVRAQILDLLAELSERLQIAYLFVTHDLTVVRAIADRVYVMQRGRIVEAGSTHQVFSQPQHAYTQTLLAATPRLADEGADRRQNPGGTVTLA